MANEITRNGGGAGYGAEERAEALPPRRPPVLAVPPMEAEWLRAVGGRPAGLGRPPLPNGGGPNGVAPAGPDTNGRGAKG